MSEKKILRTIKKRIGIMAVVGAMMLGTVASAASFGVAKYHYANNNVYGISAASSGFSGYVTTWCKASDNNSYHYNSSRKKNYSSASAQVVWDSGNLQRSAGCIY